MTDEAEAQEQTQQESQEEITSSENDISALFDDSEEEAEAEETGEKGSEGSEQSDDEKGEQEESEKSGESDEESPSSKDESANDKEAALQAELQRTRKLKREVEEKLKQYESGKEQEQEMPDPVSDPEGYAAYLEDKQNQRALTDRIVISQEMMKDTVEDYTEMEKVFTDLLGEFDYENNEWIRIDDPQLHYRFLTAPNPAKFAYNHAKAHVESQNLKSNYDSLLKSHEDLKKELEVTKKQLEDVKSGKVSADEAPDLTNATESGKNTKGKTNLTENPEDMFPDED